MGLGADTIEALAAPYREGAELVKRRSLETIKYVASHGSFSCNAAIRDLTLQVSATEIFDAVALGEVTAADGAMVLGIRRQAEHAALPWYVRVALWLSQWGR